MVENRGTMPSPRSAEPVIALKLCRRCSDLLGKLRNHGIRKLAGAATKASRRTVQEQLRGKAEPRRRRLCINKRSEERRVGEECVCPCRSLCAPDHSKKKKKKYQTNR